MARHKRRTSEPSGHHDTHHASHGSGTKVVNGKQMNEACALSYRVYEKAHGLAAQQEHGHEFHVISTHLQLAQRILEPLDPTHGHDHITVDLKALTDADHQLKSTEKSLTRYPHHTKDVVELTKQVKHLINILDDLIHIDIPVSDDRLGHDKPPPVPPRKKRHKN